MLGRGAKGRRQMKASQDAAGRLRRRSTFRRPLLVALILALALAALSASSAVAGGGAPAVETERGSDVGRTSVMLNGSVNPNGSEVTECYFEYGTSEASLTSTAQCSYSPLGGETPVPVNATLEGLPESTTYYYRLHAKSAAGESSGGVRELTTLPTAPAANTEQARSVGRTAATLTGFVTPNDSDVTECYFEWGTVPSELDQQAACSQEPGSGSERVAVSATITGLSESTVYYYRVVARNSFALEQGGRAKVETLPAAPRANTEPAAAVTHTSATLRGFVTPNGANVEDCYFEWGIHSSEEHTAPCEQTNIGAGEEPVAVTAKLTGLTESSTYHYHLVAGNDRGTNVGGGVNFSTLPFVAKTLISRVEELTSESGLLRGEVDPQGVALTECSFEYGTTPALGKAANCATLPGSGEKFAKVTASVNGLSPTTTYLVRLRATNAFGTVYSREESFTSFEAGVLPVVAKIKPRKGSSAGGTPVTVAGTALEGAKAVLFGETETTAITSDSPDSLTVIAPPGVGTVDVIVVTASGESKPSGADAFTYGAPTVTGASPNHGSVSGGTEVTVTGTGFEPGTSGTSFKFGKVAASSVECTSSSSCTMIAPAAYKGRAAVVVVEAIVNGKKSKRQSGDTFTYTT